MTEPRVVWSQLSIGLGICVCALVFLGGCEERYSLEAPRPAPSANANTPAPHAQAKPRLKGTAGPLKTAMVGGYMDAQEKDFRARLHGVPVMRVGDDIVVSFRDDLLFKGSTLSSRGRDQIGHLAELLGHY